MCRENNRGSKVKSDSGSKRPICGSLQSQHRANPNGRITSGKPTGNPPKK